VLPSVVTTTLAVDSALITKEVPATMVPTSSRAPSTVPEAPQLSSLYRQVVLTVQAADVLIVLVPLISVAALGFLE